MGVGPAEEDNWCGTELYFPKESTSQFMGTWSKLVTKEAVCLKDQDYLWEFEWSHELSGSSGARPPTDSREEVPAGGATPAWTQRALSEFRDQRTARTYLEGLGYTACFWMRNSV